MTIGGLHGWATQLLEPLDKLEAALGELKNLDGPSFVGPAARLAAIRRVIERCKVAEQNTSRVEATFLQKLNRSNLNRALNEVMALFTPARWAYHDVKVTYAQGTDTQQLSFDVSARRTNGSAGTANPAPQSQTPAELWLNTAELNVFTVSLFLLCAMRVSDNPLGLVILDDPLQNMDELTVSALARGVAKIVRLLPQGWRLALLFHGQDDAERFRHEVPCALYVLPWLTPSLGSTDNEQPLPIQMDPLKSRTSAQLRNPSLLIEDRQKSTSGSASANL